MKNFLYTIAAAALAVTATPALAQTQVTLGGDVVTSGRNDGQLNPRIDISNFELNRVGAGVEGRSAFGEGVDEVTARLGSRLGAGRLSVTPTVQLGLANVNDDGRDMFATFGAGAEARFGLVAGLDAVGSVNYRQAFEGRDRYRLTEYRVGADYNVNDRFAVGARYFDRNGTVDSSGVAAAVTVRM